MDKEIYTLRGREITFSDLEQIREIVSRHWDRGRSHISRVLCDLWDWRQPNGWLKDRACRDILLRLERAGLLKLPPRKQEKNNTPKIDLALPASRVSTQGDLFFDSLPSSCNALNPVSRLRGHIGDYTEIGLVLVRNTRFEPLWNSLVQQHHYLGCPTIVGSYLKYLLYLNGTIAACLGWGSAAWKVRCRDDYIGWTAKTREQRLCHIVNNVRFLILPWVEVTHLASKALSMGIKSLAKDWREQFGYPVYLVETFVDTSRFTGTCYKAANWRYLGHTRGSGKKGAQYYHHGQPKAVYVYPLVRNFQKRLTDD